MAVLFFLSLAVALKSIFDGLDENVRFEKQEILKLSSKARPA